MTPAENITLTADQILAFRLLRHQLAEVPASESSAAEASAAQDPSGIILEALGNWPVVNSPPGACENALFTRFPFLQKKEIDRLLYQEKSLLQAWSFRGAPCIFPLRDKALYLKALIPQEKEPWPYTEGIMLALDAVHMTQEALLPLVERAAAALDHTTITGKAALDQFLAALILPMLPEGIRPLWTLPSCYGPNQTMGEAAVSFLLRPCSLKGLVVFGERTGRSPSFTSPANWTGTDENAEKRKMKKGGPEKEPPALTAELIRRYLRAYAPASPAMFAAVLGISEAQSLRMWQQAGQLLSIIPVSTPCGTGFILEEDLALFRGLSGFWDAKTQNGQKEALRPIFSHDPYLDCRDRDLLLPDRKKQRELWKYVGNPGAILLRGRIVGFFRTARTSSRVSAAVTLWVSSDNSQRRRLEEHFAAYAAFLGLRPGPVTYQEA